MARKRKRQLSELGMFLSAKLPLVVSCHPPSKACYAGSIPIELCIVSEPTTSDIMAQRVQPDGKVYRSMVFDTAEEAYSFARSKGYDPQ